MKSRLASAALSAALFALLIGAWKGYVEWFDVSRFVLPPPEDVATATWDLLGDGRTWEHARVTLWEIVAGFGIAAVLGVSIGVSMGEVRVIERALTPYLVAFQVLPKVAIIPLLINWFGFEASTKIVVAATFAFFPVVAATRAGIRSIEPGHRDLVATLGASRRQRVALLDLPSALPSILTGLEVAIVFATVGAIVAEYLAGSEGLGWLAVISLNNFRVDDLFGVIVLLSVLGFVLHALVAALRRIVVPWHPSADTRPPGL